MTKQNNTPRRHNEIDGAALLKMLESSYDGIWITDGQGRVLFANSANATLLGMTPAELIGKSTEQLLSEKVFSDSVILEAIEKRGQISKELFNYNTNLKVLATATPIFDHEGRIQYVFNNVREIGRAHV